MRTFSDQSKTDTMTPGDVVARWRNTIGIGTLANWRSNGIGPAYIKVGGRVLYRRSDIEAWETKNHREPEVKRKA